MSRNKLSEYRSKHIVASIIGDRYVGWSIESDLSGLEAIEGFDSYVVKVDQAIKKRFKNGLVALDVSRSDLKKVLTKFRTKGYDYFLVEPYMVHETEMERYLSFQRIRDGVLVSYSTQGGINVEHATGDVASYIYSEKTAHAISKGTGIEVGVLRRFYDTFNAQYLSFLEINPYIIVNEQMHALDSAVEVDSVSQHLVTQWSPQDVRFSASRQTPQEVFVRRMNEESSASFSLSVLNPNGSLFLLLSGGGASIVIADEIYERGRGQDIANYGEYSGNPTRHETYLYANQVLKLVEQSTAPSKKLFIGGAVANFTDIATTFNGIIDALKEHASALKKQDLKVFVRRGGPREAEGLRSIEQALRELGLYGGVYGPDVSISDSVEKLLQGVNHG